MTISEKEYMFRRILVIVVASLFILVVGFGVFKLLQIYAPNIVNRDPTITIQPTVSSLPTAIPAARRDIKINAVYVTGNMAGSTKFIDSIIELSKTSTLNAVVIDVKEDGSVNYKSEVPKVVEFGNMKNLYNPRELLQKLHDNNIYVIGRVVCFRDRMLASQRKDLAVKTASGEPFKDNKHYWLNAFLEENQNYNIDIAKEAVMLGFDEIQFDYVRFPAQKEAVYASTEISKTDAILKFLKKAHDEISIKLNKPVGADIFAIVIESKLDGEHIGQDFQRMGEVVDYIYPMVYPSHWANKKANGTGQQINGVLFTAPDLKPYEVVSNISKATEKLIIANPNFKAKIRSYLQDFTLTPKGYEAYYQTYTAAQVNDQIRGLKDAGFDEWVLWNGSNQYSYDVFKK